MPINPWSSENIEDYQHLMDEFGMRSFDPTCMEDMPRVMRRGTVVGQRGFSLIKDAIEMGNPYAMLTGLMPSGRMHLGHKMVIDQVIWYQRHGSDTFVSVADMEAFATRGYSLDRARQLALEEYIKNYIALGLKPKKTQIYFQSTRSSVKDLAYTMGKKVNGTQLKEIYGFTDTTSIAHIMAPLIQVGDILHVQLEKYGGPRPTIVPVGLDQDPHIRFTRDLAQAHRIYSIKPLTGEPGLGVFLKGDYTDDKADALLKKAMSALKSNGYEDLTENLPYRQLKVHAATEWDMDNLSIMLSQPEVEMGGYGFYPPSATYHKFMRGLTGGKMSSSKPDTAIFLSDNPREAAAKARRAFTGGRQTLAEQKEKGGEPEKCSIFEMFVNHLVDSDEEVNDIYDRCRNGELMCGTCKKMASERIEELLTGIQEKKSSIEDEWKDYIVDDNCTEQRGD